MTEVSKAGFGKNLKNEAAEIYTLKNAKVEAKITTYGATLVSVRTADRHGKVADVVLGYDNLRGLLFGRDSRAIRKSHRQGRLCN